MQWLKIVLLVVLFLFKADAICKWFGTSPFCKGSGSSCTSAGMVYVTKDKSGDGKKCWTGNKVKCCDPAPIGCNGATAFCKLRFDQATFAGTHNSASGANGLLKYGSGLPAVSCLYRNQDMSFTNQLRFGIRAFDLDICYHGNTFKGCHKDAYGMKMSDIFKEISLWLKDPDNRKQVVVLRMSDLHGVTKSNSGRLYDNMKYWFSGVNGWTGLNDFKHRGRRWPTLQEAVNENKRVFVFTKSEACDSACYRKYPWLLSQSYLADTWDTVKITKSCSGIVQQTEDKCKQHASRSFVIASIFGSYGVCTWDMAGYCDNWLRKSIEKCKEEREKRNKSVNFIMVDFPEKAPKADNVVVIAKEQNEKNVKRLNL